jgi:hypothetical protein
MALPPATDPTPIPADAIDRAGIRCAQVLVQWGGRRFGHALF